MKNKIKHKTSKDDIQNLAHFFLYLMQQQMVLEIFLPKQKFRFAKKNGKSALFIGSEHYNANILADHISGLFFSISVLVFVC